MLPDIDAVTRDDLIRLITRYRLRLIKRLSQHFVVDPTVIRDIINHVPSGSKVLEVGTGIGVLTYYLAKVASQVVTIEIDGRLMRIAEQVLRGLDNVSLVQGDALRIPWPSADVLVSNVPYSITSPLIIRIIREGVPRALLTIQREVANRLISEPGNDDYGRLSIITQCNYSVSVLNTYAPDSFYPSPEVYSSLVVMIRKEPCYSDMKILESTTNILFRHRNKVLRWVLNKYIGPDAVNAVANAGVNVNTRVRQLGINELVKVADSLKPFINSIVNHD
ncbi:16S rRNA (adenine(1518)-N(6)/adenine(1519)-N(6))-dimethyltransferase RsmA [Vulcanisaeta sp. JCM 14467]|uniref:16S rRNA (adenine(1518)-N(6)/adenine(1519)-N(6))- dimethyltransferase RsmA n=1 Tax=Vulcanisaeta sp. JCM 14467 TaxID=1295370 RepID=UPI0006D0D531|nr:16S rRNA (adenine(1518)-N(6)/adenine(1519)-N(6))-dimethyltransferase RsmA [Vulcanisaeta sp. JCM 14467]